MEKKRVVKDYEALNPEILALVKQTYPHGFSTNLVSYANKDGVRVTALPFETEDVYYLIRMTEKRAKEIIENDDDYDDAGNLIDGTYDSENEEEDPIEYDDEGMEYE